MTEPLARCAFARAILAGQAGCALGRRQSRGESESVACASPVAHFNCALLLDLLRERGTFALRLPPPARPLVHAQSMRLQCGGALAIAQALGRDRPDDLHDMVAQAHVRWGGLADIPFAQVVAAMAGWRARRRAAGKGEAP